jgi:hypothetical protein
MLLLPYCTVPPFPRMPATKTAHYAVTKTAHMQRSYAWARVGEDLGERRGRSSYDAVYMQQCRIARHSQVAQAERLPGWQTWTSETGGQAGCTYFVW